MNRRLIRLLALVFVAIVGLAGLGACDEESAGPEAGTTVEDVTQNGDAGVGDNEVFEDPSALVGEQVTVSGEVTSLITDQAFRISGDDVGGEPVLVFSASPVSDLEEGVVVQVTGTVRQVVRDTFEEDFGFAFDEQQFGEFTQEHAIAADQVEVLQTNE